METHQFYPQDSHQHHGRPEHSALTVIKVEINIYQYSSAFHFTFKGSFVQRRMTTKVLIINLCSHFNEIFNTFRLPTLQKELINIWSYLSSNFTDLSSKVQRYSAMTVSFVCLVVRIYQGLQARQSAFVRGLVAVELVRTASHCASFLLAVYFFFQINLSHSLHSNNSRWDSFCPCQARVNVH